MSDPNVKEARSALIEFAKGDDFGAKSLAHVLVDIANALDCPKSADKIKAGFKANGSDDEEPKKGKGGDDKKLISLAEKVTKNAEKDKYSEDAVVDLLTAAFEAGKFGNDLKKRMAKALNGEEEAEEEEPKAKVKLLDGKTGDLIKLTKTKAEVKVGTRGKSRIIPAKELVKKGKGYVQKKAK